MQKLMTSKRVLEIVLNRHGTKDLCDWGSESICYSLLMEQQRERAKHISKDQDEEWKKTMTSNTGKFQIHTHGNK